MDSFWDFFWFMVATFLFVGYLVVLFQIVVDLFRDRSVGGVAKAVWVLCLLFLPFLTALVYLIVRGGGMAERQVASMRAAQQETETYIKSVAGGGGSSPAAEIAHAKELLDAGTITQTEYEALKAKALS
jgi:hypothetical protein